MSESGNTGIGNEINEVHTLPMEINSELKIKGTIPISLIAAVFCMFFISQRFDWMVYEPLKLPWYIYNVVIAMIMCVKTKRNGGKNVLQSILLYLNKNDYVYKPIDNPREYTEMEAPELDET